MDDYNTKIFEEQSEINNIEPDMRACEEYEEEYIRTFDKRIESEEMYMISTILTSDF